MDPNISKALKIVVFIFMIVIADKVLGMILQNFYFKQKSGENHSLNYVFSECNADVLIFGNSRAQHHYDSRIISNGLKMSCYNAGQDGGHSILLSFAQIKIVLERYSPKIIILEFSLSGIGYYSGLYDRLSILLPYYRKYPELRPLIQLKSPFESTKLLSWIYPFNSNLINIIRFNTNYHKERKQDYDGYVPLKGRCTIDMLKSMHQGVAPSIVDNNLVNALENIIYLCKAKGVMLFIVNSPWFTSINERKIPLSTTEKMTLQIINRNQVNHMNFSSDSTFIGHFELFDDLAHLNDDGAKKFSNMLVDSLKSRKTIFQKVEK